MVLAIESARILDWLRDKCGGLPKGPRIKRFKSIEFERNVRRRPCRDQASGAKPQAESADTYRQTLIVSEIRHDINKCELQVNWVSLHRRRGQSIAFIESGDAFREDPHALAQMQVGKQRDAL